MENNNEFPIPITSLPDGFTYHRVLFDQNSTPIDSVFVEVNPAFERITGNTRQEIIGKNVTTVLSKVIRDHFDWQSTYGQATTNRKSVRFEHFFVQQGRWYEATVYSMQQGFLATIYHAISEEKNASHSVQDSQQLFEDIKIPEKDLENIELSDIIDIPSLQSLLDDFYNLTHIGISLVDLNGRVLANAGLQDICTQFHKVQPETAQFCLESDIELSRGVAEGEFKIYKCKNNMWDVATPLMVGGKHLGNLFMGQFFFEDEPIDYELFRDQARRFGFNERSYISALKRVPRWSRETVYRVLQFYTKLAHMLSLTSYKNLTLARSLNERNRLVQSLQESEEYLSATLHCIGDGVIVTDEKGNVTRLNTVAAELTGWTMKEAQGRSLNEVFQVINEKTGKRYDNPLSLVFSEEKAHICDSHTELINRDGTRRPIADSVAPIRNREGKILGAVLVFRDQSEERTITRNLHIMHASIESSPDAIALLNLDGHLTYVNPAFLRLWGYEKKGQVQDTTLMDFLHDKDKIDEVRDQVQKDTPFYGELRAHRKDGSQFLAELSLSLVKDRDGHPICMIAFFYDITEQKQVEEKLKKQEEMYRELIESTEAIAWEYDILSDRWTYLAPQAEKILGYRPVDWTNLAFWISHLHPEDRDWASNYCAECTQKGENHTFEYRFRRKNGDYVWLRDVVSVEISGKNPVKLRGYMIDITERKRAEEALQLERILLRTIIDHIPDSIYAKDMEARKILANPADLMNMGIKSEKEALGKTDYETFPQDIAEAFSRDDQKVLKNGKPVFNREERAVALNGKERWLLTSKIPLRDEEGRLIGLVGIGRDITKQKQAEEKLRQERILLRTIIDNLPVGIYIKDLKGRKTLTNPTDLEYMGFTKEDEVLGKTDFEIYPPEIAKQFRQDDKFVLKNGKPVLNREEKATASDGKERWLLTSKIPLRDEEGRLIGLVGIGSDITEKKKSEERIRYLSFHDPLTGLYNRAYLEEEMKRLDTERQLPLGIIMADINGLKLVNDTYGHQTGDELLKNAARVLKNACRKEDIIARWGGDEFVIFLPHTSITEGETICRRITLACARQRTENLPLSIALGISAKTQVGEDIIQVFREAEDRMYQNKLAESRSARSAVLSALRETLQEKRHETEEHTHYITYMARLMGKALGLSPADLDRLALLSSLHDIGMITLSEDILSKSGPLNEQEWAQIRKHPETGYRIARSTDELANVAEEILSHHECWDGTGYPRGLRGEEIPLLSRISAIIEAYDAMMNHRPYRKALSSKEALEELKRCAGTKFDPSLVKVFVELAENGIV